MLLRPIFILLCFVVIKVLAKAAPKPEAPTKDCPICIGSLADTGSGAVKALACGCCFHTNCIDKWLKTKKTNPHIPSRPSNGGGTTTGGSRPFNGGGTTTGGSRPFNGGGTTTGGSRPFNGGGTTTGGSRPSNGNNEEWESHSHLLINTNGSSVQQNHSEDADYLRILKETKIEQERYIQQKEKEEIQKALIESQRMYQEMGGYTYSSDEENDEDLKFAEKQSLDEYWKKLKLTNGDAQ
uniref:RING-type domain-containing protein n=1 Tax=Globodera pallida TaxID=36090 RepID=A0A183BJA1_GLOPA